ncbi:MAG: hypothetical protein HQM08_09285 [Candidatus Riflebacteria bacterium]|nr:hypothetical protein [Candidatus Riflebacteria bacterium]
MKRISGKIEWLLLESPTVYEEFIQILPELSKRSNGLILRFGAGLSPFLFTEKIFKAGIKSSIFIHLRDTNEIGLLSTLKSADALGIKNIFVGDPLPVTAAVPFRKMEIFNFLKFAKNNVSPKTIFGTCLKLSHPADHVFMARAIASGVTLLAIENENFPPESFPLESENPQKKLEFLFWRNLNNQTAKSQFPELLDLSCISSDDPAAILKEIDKL